MKRKLIKQAGQALTVTLPIDWIRTNNLKPGDEIDLDQVEKNLILKSEKKPSTGSVKLSTRGLPKGMNYLYLYAAYARGIDEIKLESDSYPDVSDNIGFAVVEQDKNNFTIRDISGPTSENLDDIFKRVFQMVLAFYDNAFIDMFSTQKASYELIKKMDLEINKFCLFLERSIMKLSYPDPVLGRIMFAYSYELEKIGDDILRLWRTDIQNTVKKDDRIKEIVLLSKEALDKAFEAYYQSSNSPIEKLGRIKETIRKKSEKLFNINAAAALFIIHAVKIVEDCYDLTQLSMMKRLKPE